MARRANQSRLLILVFMAFVGCDPQSSAKNKADSTLAHIRTSHEISCGYLIYSPYIRRDANTGQLSGIFYDVMEQIGQNAGLKIRWAEEVGFQNIIPGLDGGRYDVFCGGQWPSSTRAMAETFSQYAFYSTILAWVRTDDDRIHTLADIKRIKARLSVIDGAIEDQISRSDYPELERVSMPDITPFSQNFQNIVTHKADVVFAEPSGVAEFLQNNPGTLRSLGQDNPVRIYGNALTVRKGDMELKEFLDYAVQELVYSGQMDKILAKYELTPDAFPRVARPYQLATQK
ncbi:MAG: transporter substrate-binding domain-containing protein [Alphaproteobacteria bacterium]|nr:transporter substrate-binding domain-containing protein [Alphaproteobacteria bacterium]